MYISLLESSPISNTNLEHIKHIKQYQTPLSTYYKYGTYINNHTKKIIVCSYGNQLIECFNFAIENNLDVSIRPDDIWLLIIQNIMNYMHLSSTRKNYIKQYPRKVFITAKSYKASISPLISTLSSYILNDSFISLMTNDYSTTTDETLLASQVLILSQQKDINQDTESHGYTQLQSNSHVKGIYVNGTVDDWIHITDKLNIIIQEHPCLQNFINILIKPIVVEFVNVFSNIINKSFWKNIHKYIEELQVPGQSIITFYKNKQDSKFQKLNLKAGFIGICIDSNTNSVVPYIDWLIIGDKDEKLPVIYEKSKKQRVCCTCQ